MSQSDFWAVNPPLPPRKNTFNGEQWDPFELVSMKHKKEDEVDWLHDDLVKLVEEHAPKPTDINQSTGKVDREALKASGESLFQAQRTFANFYQLKQFASLWAAAWGTHLSTQAGFELHCFYVKRSHQFKNPNPVSPSKRRERESMKTGCTFKIRAACKPSDKKEKVPRYLRPVKITSKVLDHTCEPSLDSLRIAKKAAGEYSLDLKKLGNVLSYFLSGNVTASQGRTLLKPFLPEGIDISSCDIRNFRARVIKFDLEGGLEPTAADATQLLSFKPLDENELIVNSQSDLTSKKVKEYLRQVLQEGGDGWRVAAFLEKIKKDNQFFDYRIWYDQETGAPQGVVWMTKSMKEKWVRFGSTISLDAMKRQLNSLHWPYIAPVVQDQELRVCVIAESLMIEESYASYAFVLQSIFEMEPKRNRSTVGIIFADCIISKNFLADVGMEETSHVIWDSFHLTSKVWPEALGEHVYVQVSEFLRNMVYAKTEEEYKKAFEAIDFRLSQNHPAALEYINGFYQQPETFAQYYVRSLPDNLGKSSSQGAEVNHASVIAHGEAGSKQDPVEQIKSLLERQEILQNKHQQMDAKYYHLARRNSLEEPNQVLKQAYLFLSEKGLQVFKGILSDSANYTKTILEDGSVSIHRRGTRIDSARILQQGEHCRCDRWLAFSSMCVHEFVANDCQFKRDLFSDRMIQPFAAEKVVITRNLYHQNNNDIEPDKVCNGGNDESEKDSEIDEDNSEIDENNNNHDNGDNMIGLGDDDELSSDDDNIALSDLLSQRRKQPPPSATNEEDLSLTQETSATQNLPLLQQSISTRPQRVPRSKIVDVCSNLTSAAEASPEISVTVYSTLTSLLDLVRGKTVNNDIDSSAIEILSRAESAISRKSENTQTNFVPPIPGRLASIGGRPGTKRKASLIMEAHGGHVPPKAKSKTERTCGFCKSKTHTANKCTEMKLLGKRIKKVDIPDFRQRVLSHRSALIRIDSARVNELVRGDNAPLIQSLPRSTKWLVVHAVYNLGGTAAAGSFMITRQQVELGVEVSCYGDLGDIVGGISEKSANYYHRMATEQAVNDWIAQRCGDGIGSGSTNLIDGTSMVQRRMSL